MVGMVNITIKGVKEEIFRNFKAESVRKGLKLGEAANEAFREWALSQQPKRARNIMAMKEAAKHMDEIRAKVTDWDGVKEIRKWRELRYHPRS